MPSSSARAYDLARKRGRYKERFGPVFQGDALRDLLRCVSYAATASNALDEAADPENSKAIDVAQRALVQAAVPLYRVAGALGLDLQTAIEHELEKREMGT
jgi:hypothetical protein